MSLNFNLQPNIFLLFFFLFKNKHELIRNTHTHNIKSLVFAGSFTVS